MQDLYSVLGVAKGASEDDVKHAFRSLAKRWHPDTADGAADKGKRFQALNAAYEILSDANKRVQYDRGEIDWAGNPKPQNANGPQSNPAAKSNGSNGAAHGANGKNGANGHGEGNGRMDAAQAFRWAFEKAFGMQPNLDTRRKRRVEDLFAEFFGERQKADRKSSTRKGVDTLYDLSITFEEAVLGGTRRVKMPNGKRFDVRVPVGVREGQVIRLKSLGEPGLAGGPDGDALITVKIEEHPFYKRDGRDITLDLPVTLSEAVLGAKIKVPTLHGPVTMAIPENSNSGTVFRLKGKGVPQLGIHEAGDQLVTLVVQLPEKGNAALQDFVRRWEAAHPYQPRKGMGSA
jgi:DnaJ-class molecular chaperone